MAYADYTKPYPFEDELSQVAGIIDVGGGLRVLVDDRMVEERLRQRKLLLEGEHLFVVPGLLLREPVEWNIIPWMVATVKRYIAHVRAGKNTVFDPYEIAT